MSMTTYAQLHTGINDVVSAAALRSVSVTAGRLRSTGMPVISALASKSKGELVRVVVDMNGKRLDGETGHIADKLGEALLAIPTEARKNYYQAWASVFLA